MATGSQSNYSQSVAASSCDKQEDSKNTSLLYKETNIKSMQAGTRSQLQLAAVCSKQAAAVCSKQAATVCSKQAATKSEKLNLHTKNAQAARLQQTMSRKIAATKSRKVAATMSSKANLHTKNSQAATMPQLAAAAKPHACCLFAAIHCEKPSISIKVG